MKNNLHFRQQSDDNSVGLKKFYRGQRFANSELVYTLAINKEKFPEILLHKKSQLLVDVKHYY